MKEREFPFAPQCGIRAESESERVPRTRRLTALCGFGIHFLQVCVRALADVVTVVWCAVLVVGSEIINIVHQRASARVRKLTPHAIRGACNKRRISGVRGRGFAAQANDASMLFVFMLCARTRFFRFLAALRSMYMLRLRVCVCYMCTRSLLNAIS